MNDLAEDSHTQRKENKSELQVLINPLLNW